MFTSPVWAVDEKKRTEYSEATPMAAELARKSGADFEAAYPGMMILHHQGDVGASVTEGH